jgi:Na+-transporting methylmalonyl-CoA/oxaloacetate decarboxylase gamma subunit
MLAVISSLAERPTLIEILTQHLPFQLIGISVVLVALLVLYATCSAVSIYFRKVGPPPTPVAAPTPPPEAATLPVPESDVVLAAVIAAAVAVAIDRPHRVLEIHPAEAPVAFLNAWAIEGRFQHFSSHKVR